MIKQRASVGPGLVIVLFLALGTVGCGGDDDGDRGEQTTAPAEQTPAPAERGGEPLEIDPQSGPAGTTISWTISTCEESDDKGAAVYAGPLKRYRSGASTKRIIEGRESKEPSGTITVPDDVAPGEYVVTVSCLSAEERGEGQVELGVKEETAGFTVTE
jgi:hypothetical protein